MSQSITWKQFWARFETSTSEEQTEYIEQLNIAEHVSTLGPRYQIEVLEDAPKILISLLADILHPSVRIRLVPEKAKMTDYLR